MGLMPAMSQPRNDHAHAAPAVGLAAIFSWTAAVVVLYVAGFFRLTVDALTCGDDGPADYGNRTAQAYCDLLDGLHHGSGLSIVASLDPGSVWWFAVSHPAAVLGGALAMRSRSRSRIALAAGAVWAITLLVLLPAIYGGPGVLFYALPVGAAFVASFVALGIGRTRAAACSVGAGAGVSALLAVPAFAVG